MNVVLKILEIVIVGILLYSIVEDIRKTAINDYIAYIVFFISLLYSVIKFLLTKDIYYLILIILSIVLLNIFYVLFIYGYIGDADGFFIVSALLLVGLKKFLIFFPLGVITLSISNIIIIFYKTMKKIEFIINSSIFLFLSILIFYLFGAIPLTLFNLLVLLRYYSNEEKYLYYKEKREKILPLDYVKIKDKVYLVIDKNYLEVDKSFPKFIKIFIPSSFFLKKLKYKVGDYIEIDKLREREYLRKIPLPFLPILLGIIIPNFFVKEEIEFFINFILKIQMSP